MFDHCNNVHRLMCCSLDVLYIFLSIVLFSSSSFMSCWSLQQCDYARRISCVVVAAGKSLFICHHFDISTVLIIRCCPPLDQSSLSCSSLQQCARRVSCVVVANRQTPACHLIFLKRALLCICTLQNLHMSQCARFICTLEIFIFLNVHYALPIWIFYIFQCAWYILTLENFIFLNVHGVFALSKIFYFPTCTP